ncbi:MAG: TrkH family potassium uptake protein [Solirubrobacteraceae bacterium]|nr:TrkH family potassium uptake protein [Solirubrobacteraceae bacterium]
MHRARLHPAQALVLAFAAVILLATGLLMLPAATASGESTGFVDALLHATTTLCVTGVVSLDTATHWSTFGHIVLAVCMQLGAFGIMTFATALGVLVARRLRLSTRILAAAETGTIALGDLRRILRGVVVYSLAIEVVVAVALALRWWLAYDLPFGKACWYGVFHSVAAFTNTGISLYTQNMVPFASDPFILLPLAAAVILGGLGFPVLLELRREMRGRLRWSLNTKLVLSTTAVLLVVGGLFVIVSEWSNPRTLGALDDPGAKILSGFFQATMTRSGGFNSWDLSASDPTTWFGMDILMFIGAGPGGTGGGIKVTTLAVLALLVWSEIRGHDSVHAFGKRIPAAALRQAITVTAISSAVILAATIVLMKTDDLGLDRSLFEIVSAFGTVGLTTGITPTLTDPGKLLLVILMFAGRIGPITLASAIALRRREREYEYAEERPLIG